MRVADLTKYVNLKTNLGDIQQRLARAQEMIASGRKILEPSDDPVVSARLIQMGAEQQRYGQLKTNLERLQLFDATCESSLTTMHDLLTQAKQLAITQSSDTMGASERNSAAQEIRGIIEHLVTLGNTKVGSTFIFGGKKSNSAPFTLDPADYSVTFGGSADVTEVFVEQGEKMRLGMSGSDVFNGDGVDVFQVLMKSKDALETNDAAGIRNSLTGLDGSLDLTEKNTAYIGITTSRVESLLTRNSTVDLSYTAALSNMAEADITAVIADFNTLTTAYQSMIYTMSKIQDLSIFNYLR